MECKLIDTGNNTKTAGLVKRNEKFKYLNM